MPFRYKEEQPGRVRIRIGPQHYRPLNTRTPFPSSLVPLFQNESKCETILMNQNDFDLHEHETACRTHFHMKGFALDSF